MSTAGSTRATPTSTRNGPSSGWCRSRTRTATGSPCGWRTSRRSSSCGASTAIRPTRSRRISTRPDRPAPARCAWSSGTARSWWATPGTTPPRGRGSSSPPSIPGATTSGSSPSRTRFAGSSGGSSRRPGHARRAGTGSRSPETEHLERRHRLVEALEGELAHRLVLDQVFDGGQHSLRDEDLARLGLAAQTGGQGAGRPARAGVPAALQADRAQRGRTLRDPHAEVEFVPALVPGGGQLVHALLHRQRHPDGALGRVGHRYGVVEEHEEAVAGEVLERPLVGEDLSAHLPVVLAEDRHHLF